MTKKHIHLLFQEIQVSEIQKEEFKTHNGNPLSLYKGFFISKEIFGSLFETSDSKIYLLITEHSLYRIEVSHFNLLVLQHYIYCLGNDIERYEGYQNEQSVSYPKTTIKEYSQLIQVFREQCIDFGKTYPEMLLDSYSYVMSFRYLVSLYGSLRITLLGSAESLFDSKKSNNFLLLGVDNLELSSYFRVKTWLIENQEHYIKNIFNFPNSDSYHMTLYGSGMRAIGLLIQYLLHKKSKNVLLIGEIYFETIKLLESYFPQEHIHYYDPSDGIENIGEILDTCKPDAIFIDSTTLSLKPYIFTKDDFNRLLSHLENNNSQAKIVFDITTKYTYLSDYSIPNNCKNEVFFVGSVGKYLYGGMDLGFSGYMFAPKNSEEFFSLFSNSGAGVSNIDALKIPVISKYNHEQIAQNITEKISSLKILWNKSKSSNTNISVCFSLPENENTDAENFYGNFINIGYKTKENNKKILSKNKKIIVQKIMDACKKHDIDASYSTSYGFYNTRISVFTCESVQAIKIVNPCYIRISLGYSSKISDVYKLMKIIHGLLEGMDK